MILCVATATHEGDLRDFGEQNIGSGFARCIPCKIFVDVLDMDLKRDEGHVGGLDKLHGVDTYAGEAIQV